MNIMPMDISYQTQANRLWNTYAEKEFPHKILDEQTFRRLFVEESRDVRKISLVAVEGSEITGFINGVYCGGSDAAYITFVLVHGNLRRKGIGRALLGKLEQLLCEAGEQRIKRFEIVFFNPVNLEWCVPDTEGHDHPNAPGVDVSGPGYLFLKNCGYRDFACQNSYYRKLENFEFPRRMAEQRKVLADSGITVEYYNSQQHNGLNELFDDLGNEQWRNIIIQNVSRPDGGKPVLVVVKDGIVQGFTGPLYVQSSGRGYFAGIGIHTGIRKNGAGKVLFSSLCQGLKDMGAGFMTLFTGESNPARNIYESAGFKIVKTWADMRKEI